MKQRILTVTLLASVLAACASPLESATSNFIEQVRLGDPAAQQTYAENRELFESAEALPIWLNALETGDSPQVQRWAATILGSIGDESALPALSTAMSGSRDVRDAAIDAIAQFDAGPAAAAYTAALETGNRDAQATGLAALARMGADAASAVPVIAGIAAARQPIISNTAVNTLGDIATAEAITALGDVARNGAVGMEERKHAIQNLQRIDDPAAAAQLAEVATAVEAEEGADELREVLG
jgi:hypothetical protein